MKSRKPINLIKKLKIKFVLAKILAFYFDLTFSIDINFVLIYFIYFVVEFHEIQLTFSASSLVVKLWNIQSNSYLIGIPTCDNFSHSPVNSNGGLPSSVVGPRIIQIFSSPIRSLSISLESIAP